MSSSKSDKSNRVILKMSVQLPAGQKGVIHVFPGSDPHELAEAFCLKHELADPKLRQVVERHIIENMNQLKSSKASASGTKAASQLRPERSAPADSGGTPRAGGADSLRPAASGASAAETPRAAGQSDIDSKRLFLQYKVVRALTNNLWESRVRQASADAEERASKAREAEIAELHAANARIARLAFEQAGRVEPEPTPPALPADDADADGADAARLREQLDRVLARDLLRQQSHEKAERQRRVFQSWQLSWSAARTAAATPAAPPTATPAASASPGAREGVQEDAAASVVVGGAGSSATGADAAGGDAALAASDAKVVDLTALVEKLTREVEELTTELIHAKLGQAELETSK